MNEEYIFTTIDYVPWAIGILLIMFLVSVFIGKFIAAGRGVTDEEEQEMIDRLNRWNKEDR